MKKSGFKPRLWTPRPARQCSYVARPREVATSAVQLPMAIPAPKVITLQHRGYMDLVRALACERCGWPPRSQFCHSDLGKGGAIKSDCRLGWPGCGPHLNPHTWSIQMLPGCHHDIGTARVLPKGERRAFEAEQARLLALPLRMWCGDSGAGGQPGEGQHHELRLQVIAAHHGLSIDDARPQ